MGKVDILGALKIEVRDPRRVKDREVYRSVIDDADRTNGEALEDGCIIRSSLDRSCTAEI